MFNKPNPKQNFFEMEQQILKWWKDNEILEKSIEQRPEEKIKTFYDGPITANGEPHTGHMLTFSLKDIIPRYWSMKGYKVSRSLGWDCHGIPVEYEIEKKLGFQEKKDIEKYGIEKFNQLCKESVIKYQKNIVELEENIGRLTNSEEEYATMDSKFIESIWWSLKELFDKGLLYEGFKVVPYSTRAGTTLSNAEVALGGYKPIVDPAITVEFELKEEPGTFFLAWTTTPWTIPSNLGLAINPEIEYVKIESNSKKYIVAKKLVESVFIDKKYKIISEIKTEDISGKEYIPPFDFFVGRKNAHKVYEAEYVSTESGTGIVHLAPYGAEDNEVFQKVGIESFDVLDDQGDFTSEIKPYAGMFYKKANKFIVEDLKNLDRLFRFEQYEHEMPMCWRTKTPLIYKPITSWYVAMSKLRNELVTNNEKINWIPKHAKHGRFGNWLAEIKDWSISRKRYWGTPLPVWKSESGKTKFIGSFTELEELSGQKLDDPHRPFVDEIEFEIEGEKYKRIPDVIDVWYDSGAMPFARFHYPFENKDKFEKKFPAEYIAEGIDQTRGWFYTLHAEATALFNSVAFKNVIINGTITDDQGRKLSKSLGNYTPPMPLIEMYGADSIRLNFFDSPLMYGEDAAITDKTIKQQKQEMILPLWNIFTYFTTYANLHNWSARKELANNERKVTEDSHPWDHIPFDDIDNQLDAWILMLLQETIKKVNEELEGYNIPKATTALKNLINETSKWYIRSSRERFVNGETRALEVLYYVLVETSKLLAPFAPFISEKIYQELVVNEQQNAKESIHLTDYPHHDKIFMEQYKSIINEMAFVRKLSEMGQSIRVEKGLKVRQPLQKFIVDSQNELVPQTLGWMNEILKNELNVKEIENKINLKEDNQTVVKSDDILTVKVGLDISINEELKTEGLIREFTRTIQAMRKNMKLEMGQKITFYYSTNSDLLNKLLTERTEELKDLISATNIEKTEKELKNSTKIEGEDLNYEVITE